MKLLFYKCVYKTLDKVCDCLLTLSDWLYNVADKVGDISLAAYNRHDNELPF